MVRLASFAFPCLRSAVFQRSLISAANNFKTRKLERFNKGADSPSTLRTTEGFGGFAADVECMGTLAIIYFRNVSCNVGVVQVERALRAQW